MFNKDGYIIPEKKLQQYKSTPAKEWQVLSDDEINSFYEKIKWNVDIKDIVIDFARAIEQALKQKNT